MKEVDNDNQKLKYSRLVISKLQKMISRKILKPGDKLPAERELAKEFNVSRLAIREAIKELNNAGILTTRRGSGTFVVQADDTLFSKTNPLQLIAMFHDLSNEEVLQARNLIEKVIAELAAKNATEENLAEISDELVEMFYKLDSPKDYLAHNTKFHQKIAAATGNRLLIAIVNMLVQILSETIKLETIDELNIRAKAKSNQKIYQAIRNRNPIVAGQLMHEHLSNSNL